MRKTLNLLILGAFCSVVFAAYAGPGSPNPTGGFGGAGNETQSGGSNPTGSFGTFNTLNDGPPPNPMDPDQIPLDTGVALLLAGALGFGGRKIFKDLRKKMA